MSATNKTGFKQIGVDPSKLEAIKQGKKLKSESGTSESKKVTVTKSGDKIIAVEKEKKFEEAGVTRKKRNYVMYESKLGTEKETDLTQIKAPPKPKKEPKKVEPKPRVEEKVVMKKKRIEYLDNYQYKETKEFRKADKGSIVIHERLGGPVGGVYEETSYQKITTTTGAGKGAKPITTTTTTKTETATGTANLRNQSRGAASNKEEGGETSATATKTMTQTTKVGRRGGAGGATSTTTESTTKTTTTRTTRRGK
jgi:hypothetical protein